MRRTPRTAAFILPVAVLTMAWTTPPETAQHATIDSPPPRAHADDKVVSDVSKGPAARFPTLDAYLAWLEQRAKLGGSWYREVRPGIFELQDGHLRPEGGDTRPDDSRRTFTRRELAERFGFKE